MKFKVTFEWESDEDSTMGEDDLGNELLIVDMDPELVLEQLTDLFSEELCQYDNLKVELIEKE